MFPPHDIGGGGGGGVGGGGEKDERQGNPAALAP